MKVMNRKFWIIFLSVVMLIGIISCAALGAVKIYAKTDTGKVISKGVFVEDIDLSGLTKKEAQQKVEEYVKDISETEFTLNVEDNQITVKGSDLGLSWKNTDIVDEAYELGKTGNIIKRYKVLTDLEKENKVFEIEYKVEEEAVSAIIQNQCSQFNQDAVDATIAKAETGFDVTPEQTGIAVNLEKSITAVTNYFEKDWDGKSNGSIDMVSETTSPKVLAADLEKVQDVLGSYTTDFSFSTAGRYANVENGASKVNGSVIYPGEEFSVYDTVSPFDAENGYELAGSFENGTTVQTYGGGICQVSTTLYNAVIRSELEVTLRFNHSMIVGYVDPSMDAAIAGTYKNLKFVNSTEAPVYIEGYTSGGQITFTIYGEETRPANRTVEFVSETTSETDPGIKLVATGDPVGTITQMQSSHVGKTATLWKIVYEDGVEVSRTEFNSSVYQASPEIFNVGTASSSAEATAAMNAAIATGSKDACAAAAAQWNESAIAAQKATEEAAAKAAEDAKKDTTKTDTDKTTDTTTDTTTNTTTESTTGSTTESTTESTTTDSTTTNSTTDTTTQ